MAPLLQPADCCILVVDPRARHLGRLAPTRHAELVRCLSLTLDAAVAAAAPLHLAFAGAPSDPHEWFTAPRSLALAHIHGLGTAGSCWSGSGLHTALAAHTRSSLILAGFWFENTVTFLALPALASGFEVFVLMDATPASAETSARPAADRLLQAGAVPITTRQLIAEWIEASSDGGGRSALSRLVPSDDQNTVAESNEISSDTAIRSFPDAT
jgi:nicotinamidase-related amidase